MKKLSTFIPDVTLVQPDPIRDAPFAVAWFESAHGNETRKLMGNAEDKIAPTSLEAETKIIEEFLELEKAGTQLTWAIRYQDKTIGAVWVELTDTRYLRSPALHIMIGAVEFRGKGIGTAVMRAVVGFIRSELQADVVYSRHLASNMAVTKMNEGLGFESDGQLYTDEDGLVFQNIKLSL